MTRKYHMLARLPEHRPKPALPALPETEAQRQSREAARVARLRQLAAKGRA